MPALWRRFVAGQLPESARIIGSARSEQSPDAFREAVRADLAQHGGEADGGRLGAFLGLLDYLAIDVRGDAVPATVVKPPFVTATPSEPIG